MRMLVLGGTVFLSREIARQAVARGWDVTCVSRRDDAPPRTAHVRLDRTVATDPAGPEWAALAESDWDAVIDVARTPSWVRTAVAALAAPTRHWTFVSTISVYADLSRPGGTPEDTPLLDAPPAAGGDLTDDAPDAYGRNKVACEDAVREALGDRAFIVRPGLIVGPGDPTGRFTSWPVRAARGERMVVPEPRDEPVQVIDVRDLAAAILDAAASRRTGTIDAVGPALPRERFVAEVAAGVRASGTEPATPVWVDPAFLRERGVAPWAGPRSIAAWLPRDTMPELAGMMARGGPTPGIPTRPLAETARDTLAWVRGVPGAVVGGLTAEEEADLLSERPS